MTTMTTDEKVSSYFAGWWFRLTAHSSGHTRQFFKENFQWGPTKPLTHHTRNKASDMAHWPRWWFCAGCGKAAPDSPIDHWLVTIRCADCKQVYFYANGVRNMCSNWVDFTYTPINPRLIINNPYYAAGFLHRIRWETNAAAGHYNKADFTL